MDGSPAWRQIAWDPDFPVELLQCPPKRLPLCRPFVPRERGTRNPESTSSIAEEVGEEASKAFTTGTAPLSQAGSEAPEGKREILGRSTRSWR